MKMITKEMVEGYKRHLVEEEKSENTILKYIRDIEFFAEWLGDKHLEKVVVLEYKKLLTEKYVPSSVNSKLSSLNSFLNLISGMSLRLSF